MREHPGHAVDQIRQSATRVGEDDFAIPDEGHYVADDHVDRSPARLLWVVEHRLRQVLVDESRVHPMRGVDKDDCLAPVQFLPDRLELVMAEVEIPFAIAGEQDHTVCVQDVQRVPHFLQRELRVKEIWEACEEAIRSRVGVPNYCGILIACTGKGGRGLGFSLYARSWGGDGEDRGFNAKVICELLIGLECPWRDGPP